MSSLPPSQPPAVLCTDLLYEIAEKMVCTKMTTNFNKMDLTCENGFTNFMRFNSIAQKMFFAQFVKMKEIEFSGSQHPDHDYPIKLYRSNEKGINSDGNEFYGPYIVTKEFVGALIDYGKFRVKSISTHSGYLDENLTAKKDEEVEEASGESKKCKSSIQSFCKLFLDKELPDEHASTICFSLDILKIYGESNALLASTFDELVNLNAKEIGVKLRNPVLFDCNQLNRTMKADRVEKLRMAVCSWADKSQQPIDAQNLHWESFVDFLLDTCPNIQQISLHIYFGEHPEDVVDTFEQIVFHFVQLVRKFTEQLFPALSKGNPGLRILTHLTMLCSLVDYAQILSDDKLFKIGNKAAMIDFDPDDIIKPEDGVDSRAYTARECEIADQIGRKHKCHFQLLAYDYEELE